MESISFRRRFFPTLKPVSAGFTLVEMMVVLSIIVVMTSIVLTNQGSFNKTLVLTNTAYDIALTLRSAQTYGISSRASGSVFNAGYGLHFASTPNNSFILFADTAGGASCANQLPDCKPGNYVYTPGTDVLVQTYTLGNGVTINDFCVNGDCAATALDIVFVRPNPDSFMSKNGSYSSTYTTSCLKVTSPQGGTRSISISSVGQIIANATSCP